MEVPIFILLGSNLGDRKGNLHQARLSISREIGEIITTSSIYRTAAWGNTKQPDFYNQVLKIESTCSPEELLLGLQEIERFGGRVREEKWGPRIIDIDILFYGETIFESHLLTIPHPMISTRRFTLLPLAEIVPDFVHPVTHKTIREMLLECTDQLAVERLASS